MNVLPEASGPTPRLLATAAGLIDPWEIRLRPAGAPVADDRPIDPFLPAAIGGAGRNARLVCLSVMSNTKT